jgi:predicted small secreted protein
VKTRAGILAALAALALVLGGCQSTKDGFGYDMGVIEPQVGSGVSSDMAVEYADPQSSAPRGSVTGVLEPSVITTGYLSLIVQTPAEAADQITEIVNDSGGRIASRSDYTPIDFGQPSSYLEARIPANQLDDTLDLITAVGEVQEISLNTMDVSLQKLDLDARIQVLDASMQRLRELLAGASSTSDLVAIESALAERQAELDSLLSQRAYLSDQTLFATISISVATPADATPKDPDGFVDGILRGWEGILAFFAGAIVWAGILVPWLGLLLVVVLIIGLLRAIIRRRRNSKIPAN